MPVNVIPEFKHLQFSARFAQGYRYLDRCGEAMVRLERNLDKGWVTGDINPTAGNMRNYTLGLAAKFSADSVLFDQTEFIAYDSFKDQCCKMFDILWRTFEIESVLVPVFRVVIQVGVDTSADAEAYIRQLSFVTPDKSLLNFLEGKETAMSFAVVTEDDVSAYGTKATARRRLGVNAVTQATQPDMDTRILQRVPLLSNRHREAAKALLELRRKHVSAVINAIIVDLEQTLESEYDTASLPLPDFLDDRWQHANKLLKMLPKTFDKVK